MNIQDICETGPKVYSPYPRRLESLTIKYHRVQFYFKPSDI